VDVLQFSGGKDSLACLYLLKEQWEDLWVVWMNAGAPWPQTVEQMDEVRKLVPHFIEITGRVFEQNENFGIPADVVPIVNSVQGQMARGKTLTTIQSWMNCCGMNIWGPLHDKMQELKPQRIYRGQRKDEKYRSLLASGMVIDGVEYIFPLEDWTEKQVNDFLIDYGVKIPDYYQYSDKSLDCWHCTAYLDERIRQIQWLKATFPERYRTVANNLTEIKHAIAEKMDFLDACL
jgi:3'-phosphoadenosine 5'-phosphosulfate sulfotransferase (PAPS reductase)/FAD synthetase